MRLKCFIIGLDRIDTSLLLHCDAELGRLTRIGYCEWLGADTCPRGHDDGTATRT